jgi:hypothetical protein
MKPLSKSFQIMSNNVHVATELEGCKFQQPHEYFRKVISGRRLI